MSLSKASRSSNSKSKIESKTRSNSEASLFLGIPLDPSLARTMNPHALQLFRSYLDQVEIEGRSYFGKQLEGAMNLEQIEQCQAHVMSLFKRLMPGATLPIPLCYAVSP